MVTQEWLEDKKRTGLGRRDARLNSCQTDRVDVELVRILPVFQSV